MNMFSYLVNSAFPGSPPVGVLGTCLLAVLIKAVVAFHPQCEFIDASENIFRHVEDVTALLHGKVIPHSVCIFNPAIIQVEGDIYLWAARAYEPGDPRVVCRENPQEPRPLLSADRGQGKHTFMMALTRTTWSENRKLGHDLLLVKRFPFRLEDPRLFRDDKGEVWLLMHNPRGGYMNVAPVTVTCSPEDYDQLKCDVELGAVRVLLFSNALPREKNWVPHNGTTRMSYPVYPSFAPHSILDWKSYQAPEMKDGFDSVAPAEPFFRLMNSSYATMIEFSGSTPAILSEDRRHYIAIGHIRAHPMCFHDTDKSTISADCAAMASRSNLERRNFYVFQQPDGHYYAHHQLEYAMFFYKFSSTPPYPFTHISHAIIPCSYHHHGIMYPSGLARIGPKHDFLITFGEADRFARVMTISTTEFERLVFPIEKMRHAVRYYSLCSIQCSDWTFD